MYDYSDRAKALFWARTELIQIYKMDTLKNLLSELTEIVNQNEIFKKEIIQLKKTNLNQQKEIEEIKQKYKTMQVTMGGHCKEKIRLSL